MVSIRVARPYRWRLAGGRLVAGDANLRFVPNRLERWRADSSWECAAEDVTAVQVRRKMWLVVETEAGAQTFRVFGAAAVALRIEEALHPAVTATG
jgi:hypothetical protein